MIGASFVPTGRRAFHCPWKRQDTTLTSVFVTLPPHGPDVDVPDRQRSCGDAKHVRPRIKLLYGYMVLQPYVHLVIFRILIKHTITW